MLAADRANATTSQPPPVDEALVVALAAVSATDVAVVGAKAANLARAAAVGLPVLPGFVVTTAGARSVAVAGGVEGSRLEPELRLAWAGLVSEHGGPLVVRSSSTVEDASATSMAGQFKSCLDVDGWEQFVMAVEAVLASAATPRDQQSDPRPMAVLVQPQLDPACAGVLFSIDPVTGDPDHLVIDAVPGSPDALVSGAATAVHVVVGRHGRIRRGDRVEIAVLLDRRRRRRLSELAHRAAHAFGGPQDIEWAFDDRDRLWMLQTRPVTAAGAGTSAAGPVLGPGPLAETFPDPLHALEIDLWVTPMRDGLLAALRATGAPSRHQLDRSPVVALVDGRPAVDLELIGVERRRGRQLLSPARGARRLTAAWRVGVLRASLPRMGEAVLGRADRDLGDVPPLAGLDDHQLLSILRRTIDELRVIHAHEILAGMLDNSRAEPATAAGLALAAMARGRADGLSYAEIVARDPVVLVLVAPSIVHHDVHPPATDGAVTTGDIGRLGLREALRLRCRWLQELGARITQELGRRLADGGRIARWQLVADLSFDELQRALQWGRVPEDLAGRWPTSPSPPLPVRFRLTPSGRPIALPNAMVPDSIGLPASEGRGVGHVRHHPPPDGERCVLIVETLDPQLAAVLPQLDGLVAEAGSVLSHLAILAREFHVPCVVALAGARARYPEGSCVLVDGGTGEVRLVDEEAT